MSDSLLCSCPPGGLDAFCAVHGVNRRESAGRRKAQEKKERQRRATRVRQQSTAQAYREGVLAGIKAERLDYQRYTYENRPDDDWGMHDVPPAPNWCERCRIPSDPEGLELHHKEHRSQGARAKPGDLGVDDPTNLVLLCRRCHDEQHPGVQWGGAAL